MTHQPRRNATRIGFSILVAMLIGALTATTASARPGNGDAAPGVYEITITNSTEGQYFTPPNWAVHDKGLHVYKRGTAASPGVVAVAENGGVPILAAELDGALDSKGVGDSGVAGPVGTEIPPITPGQSRTFTVTSTHDRLSIVTMLICTNDGFGGVDSKALPKHVGHSKSYNLQANDAGSELNTELDADLVPAPFCGDPAVGTGTSNPALAEDGVVRNHRTIRGVGDLDQSYDWRGPVGQVEITRIG